MKFSDIPGHEATKEALRAMVRQQRLPHALLLWGPEGAGKLALARAFAAFLHCEHPTPDGDSCGHCGPCRQHAALNFPDMLYVFPTAGSRNSRALTSDDLLEPWRTFLERYPLAPWPAWLELMDAGNAQPAIRVAESENLLHRLSHSNYGAATRVALVWLPEKLTPEAANKLLKIIEEPEPGQLFLMVSEAPQLILPTIFSRLQRIKVGEASVGLRRKWLTANAETTEFSELFRRLMRLAFSRRVGELKRWSEQAAELRREKIIRLLTYCSAQIRVGLMYRMAGPDYTLLSDDDRTFAANFSRYLTPENTARLKTEFETAARDVAGNANPRIVLFDMALQCILHIRNIQ